MDNKTELVTNLIEKKICDLESSFKYSLKQLIDKYHTFQGYFKIDSIDVESYQDIMQDKSDKA